MSGRISSRCVAADASRCESLAVSRSRDLKRVRWLVKNDQPPLPDEVDMAYRVVRRITMLRPWHAYLWAGVLGLGATVGVITAFVESNFLDLVGAVVLIVGCI